MVAYLVETVARFAHREAPRVPHLRVRVTHYCVPF